MERRLHVHNFKLVPQGEVTHSRPLIKRCWIKGGIFEEDTRLIKNREPFSGQKKSCRIDDSLSARSYKSRCFEFLKAFFCSLLLAIEIKNGRMSCSEGSRFK